MPVVFLDIIGGLCRNLMDHYLSLNLLDKHKKKTTIFLLLKFTEEKEIRNSKNQSKLSLNIENQLIENIIFPIKGCLLALIYLLQLNHISKNENYITSFDNNLIIELYQN